jgi:hypothetical protein
MKTIYPTIFALSAILFLTGCNSKLSQQEVKDINGHRQRTCNPQTSKSQYQGEPCDPSTETVPGSGQNQQPTTKTDNPQPRTTSPAVTTNNLPFANAGPLMGLTIFH